MTWTFSVEAQDGRRLLSKILQVFESQMVTLQSFHGDVSGGKMTVRCVVSSEQDKAYRIEALLHRIHEMQTVSVQCGDDGRIPL